MVFYNDQPTMDKHRNHLATDILDLTLEIIYLITGEDYTVVKKSPSKRVKPHMSEGESRTKSDNTETSLPSLIHEQKILELTNKITEMLTGEVPLRCQDVTIYFSTEEWEYLEGHKDRYLDILMKDHHSVPSVDREKPLLIKEEITDESSMISPPETYPYPTYSHGFPENMQIVKLDHQESFGVMTNGLEKLLSVKDEHWMGGSQGHLLISPFYELDYYQSLIGKQEPGLESGFICSQCGRSFKKKAHLTMHERSHSNVKPFSCSECGKCFSQKSSLVEHQKTHSGDRPVSCPECGKCFHKKSQLVGHQRIHTGEKPFPCLECGKSFNRRAYLTGHQRIHTGEKPFPCPECSRSYNHKSSLMEHLTTHTGEKPYSCSECGKRFNRKSSLADHLRVHTGEKPYLCLQCGKCFSQKSGLLVHRRTHLKDKKM